MSKHVLFSHMNLCKLQSCNNTNLYGIFVFSLSMLSTYDILRLALPTT